MGKPITVTPETMIVAAHEHLNAALRDLSAHDFTDQYPIATVSGLMLRIQLVLSSTGALVEALTRLHLQAFLLDGTATDEDPELTTGTTGHDGAAASLCDAHYQLALADGALARARRQVWLAENRALTSHPSLTASTPEGEGTDG